MLPGLRGGGGVRNPSDRAAVALRPPKGRSGGDEWHRRLRRIEPLKPQSWIRRTGRRVGQGYVQHYDQHLPAGGEIVLSGRSWSKRAGVERVR
ncbi:hypothetical protein ACF073_00785 [Streptomyces sp. NPDC015171]|uniref:hypothetical protein n=1 Tax=Streptomyces sp. NPDC015171 TaxID=3364945 RepID=UPI0037016030